jgi:hypothetical protein
MECDRAGERAELAAPALRVPEHADRHPRPACRLARRADGQFRSRTHEHRRRPRRVSGTHAHRPGRPRRQFRPQPRAGAGVRRREGERRHLARVRPDVAGRRAFARRPRVRLPRRRSRCRRECHRRACVHRWPRYAAEECGRVAAEARRQVCGPVRRAHRHRDRSLLRDGPRQPLGAGRAGVSRDHRGQRGLRCGRCDDCARCGLRPRRNRRVREADRDRRRRPFRRRRCRGVPELPRRPRPRTDACLRARGLRRFRQTARDRAVGLRDLDRICRRPAGDRGRLPAAGHGQHPARSDLGAWPQATAHRRDRKIRPRDLFPEWRSRRRFPGRGPHAGAFAQGRDLRPAAGNELPRTHREADRGDPLRPVRPDRLQHRESRHGRPHRHLRRGLEGGGSGGPCPRRDPCRDRGGRRRDDRDRRSRQPRNDARPGDRRAAHAAHGRPGADRACRTAGAAAPWCALRSGADDPATARPAATRGHDRSQPDRGNA